MGFHIILDVATPAIYKRDSTMLQVHIQTIYDVTYDAFVFFIIS